MNVETIVQSLAFNFQPPGYVALPLWAGEEIYTSEDPDVRSCVVIHKSCSFSAGGFTRKGILNTSKDSGSDRAVTPNMVGGETDIADVAELATVALSAPCCRVVEATD